MPPRVRRCRLRRVTPLVLYTFALSAAAAAQSRFQAPESCGTEAEFRSEIERLTGLPAQPGVPSSLHIEALGGEPGAYELRLELQDERRVLRDPDCRVLFRSAIVIAAAASRGEAVPARVQPAPIPSPSTPPAPLPPPATTPAVRAPERRPRVQRSATTPRERQYARRVRSRAASAAARADTNASRARAAAPSTAPDPAPDQIPRARVEPARVDPAPSPLRFGVELGLGASSGVLPDLGVKFDLGARLERGWWGAAVSFHYWPQRSDSREGRSVQVSALGGRAAALFRVAPALDVLAGLEVNRLSGEGAEGVLGRSAAAVWHIAPTLGMNFITWDIQYLRLEVAAFGRLSVQRPSFVVSGFGELYRVPVVGADAIIRGVWLFR